jgi:hypothetical protein
VVDVPPDHGARDPLGVPSERGMGIVGILPVSVWNALSGAALGDDVGVLAHQPGGHRVRRCAENHPDAARMRAVQHRLQPVELEAPVLGLPRRPHGLPDADHGQARRDHQIEIALQPVVRLVLRVVRDAVQHLLRQPGQAPLALREVRARVLLRWGCHLSSVSGEARVYHRRDARCAAAVGESGAPPGKDRAIARCAAARRGVSSPYANEQEPDADSSDLPCSAAMHRPSGDSLSVATRRLWRTAGKSFRTPLTRVPKAGCPELPSLLRARTLVGQQSKGGFDDV